MCILLLLRYLAISIGFTILGDISVYATVLLVLLFLLLFNSTIEVATFRLRGWCTLGVFLLLAFTRLGHECQDLFSPCDGMHMCTD